MQQKGYPKYGLWKHSGESESEQMLDLCAAESYPSAHLRSGGDCGIGGSRGNSVEKFNGPGFVRVCDGSSLQVEPCSFEPSRSVVVAPWILWRSKQGQDKELVEERGALGGGLCKHHPPDWRRGNQIYVHCRNHVGRSRFPRTVIRASGGDECAHHPGPEDYGAGLDAPAVPNYLRVLREASGNFGPAAGRQRQFKRKFGTC
mmetsp:Transcript_17591/g.49507  ORF Transcript_17591/g.49507 Transcript_17591/m.49507 type:complete len:202 (+) Transcript_17591:1080-1685(+)